MKKRPNEYMFLIFLLEKIEDGESNSFDMSDTFIEALKSIYKNITREELKKIIIKCKTHNWIEVPCFSMDCGFTLTERGKGVAVSKRKENSGNFWKKVNKFIGEYKNIFYIIGFCVALVVAYIKIKG